MTSPSMPRALSAASTLAFGTGGHATTRLCLTALEKIVEPGMKVLDLGCGSGILSIAALLLGFSFSPAMAIRAAATWPNPASDSSA